MEALRRQQQRRSLQSDPDAEGAFKAICSCSIVLILAGVISLVFGILVFVCQSPEASSLTVHVASHSLSLSLSATPVVPLVVSGNWSIALSVKNRKRHHLGWDHAQIMLFYVMEFVAGTFLPRFSVAPRGEGTLETSVAAFSRNIGEWAAQAMVKDWEDGGVMDLAVTLLCHYDGPGWDRFDSHGLKVGFSSQNRSQVGLLLSGSPHKCN